jgi:hypothetical protein
LLLAGFGGGVAIGRAIAPTEALSPANRREAAAMTSTTASSIASDARILAARDTHPPVSRTPLAPTPLPPAEASVAEYFDELSRRANSGDIAAARRLADDFATCAHLPGGLDAAQDDVLRAANTRATPSETEAKLETAEQRLREHEHTQARCKGIEALGSSERDWIALAARNGDPEAMLCYGLFSGDWYPEPLSPDWFAHVDLYRANAVVYTQRSFAAGVAEAAAVLSQMYVPANPFYDHRWAGRLGDDPYRALAYGYIAAATLSGKSAEFWNSKVSELAATLPPERVAEARRWADAQRQSIAFRETPTPNLRQHERCRHLRFRAAQ